MISDKGLFLTCLLMRITRASEPEIVAKLFKIMLTRTQNYIMMKNYIEEQKDEATLREISLVNDEMLTDFIELAVFILKKGLLQFEISESV